MQSVECAGSEETNSVLYPCCAKYSAVAADVVDFPTPPFPVNNINFAMSLYSYPLVFNT